jgi:hypothetical protein
MDRLTAISERLGKIESRLEELVHSINQASQRNEQQKDQPIAVNAVVRQPEGIERQNAESQHKAQTTQYAIAVAAWFAFVAALAYAVIAQLTLGQIREQTAQIYHQSEVENADSSYKAAVASAT